MVLDEAKEKLSQLEVIWVDSGYSGKNFANAVQQVCGEQVRLEVIERTSNTVLAVAQAMDCGDDPATMPS
ncbi:MAG: hypothetical protein N4J56_005913 [Chroococcidiopsis sp. SAG 2025]|nr:hypothetical protein [Chroococcidiopsis sp. SAG 2025]